MNNTESDTPVNHIDFGNKHTLDSSTAVDKNNCPKSQTNPVAKLKRIVEHIQTTTNTEPSFIEEMLGISVGIDPAGKHSEFQLVEEGTESGNQTPKSSMASPKVNNSQTFSVEIVETSEGVTSRKFCDQITVDHTQDVLNEVPHRLRTELNIRMLDEVKARSEEAKISLSELIEVTESNWEIINKEMSEIEENLSKQKQSALLDALQATIDCKPNNYTEMSPDERGKYLDAIQSIEVAKKLVQKAGFGVVNGMNEQEVARHITLACKIYPGLLENHSLRAATEHIIKL